MSTLRSALALVPFAVATALASPASAREDEFFKGRTISIVVGYVAGGGFDLAARLLAAHYGRHIPGNPNIIVQNMPGGSSVVAANYLYNVAPKDGTTIGALGSTIVINKVLRRPAKYEFDKFLWIGRLDAGDSLAVTWHTSGVRTIADAKVKAIPMAGGTSMGPAVMAPVALNKLLGTKFQIVRGYDGSAAMVMAMEKGEAAGTATFGLTALLVTKQHWLREKLVNILFLSSLERSPALPDVPTMIELAENDEQRAIFNLLTSEAVIGRNFTAPPGLPPERAATLRRAFDNLVADPVFINDLKARDIVISPWSGAKLEEYVKSVGALEPAMVERAIWATSAD
jgi:tripartite-type tricarboxylate transporter receptor subunit TctC